MPPFFGHTARHALLNAAAIAGLNVLSLLHEPSAFAFKYGFDKESDFKVRACTATAATQQPSGRSSHAAATAAATCTAARHHCEIL